MLQTTTTSVITLIIAGYAAIVSTVIAITQVANFRRDRPKIRINVSRNMVVTGDPIRNNMTFTVLKISNVGRRPVTITHVGEMHLTNAGAFYYDVVPKIPCELTEGKYALASVDEKKIDHDKIRYFYVFDATGREYRLYRAGLFRRVAWWFRRNWAKLVD
jgi:hypothetical protein